MQAQTTTTTTTAAPKPVPTGQITVRAAGNEDQPATLAKDTLGFKPYVEAVFSYLKNPQTKAPFTLSIEGDWGSGKSSFMCQLEESLKSDKKRTIRFNAWRHDKVESMWAAFALHFIKELTMALPLHRRIWANLRLRWKRFDWLKGWFPVFRSAVLLGIYGWVMLQLYRRGLPETSLSFFREDKLDFGLVLSWLGTTGILIGGLFFLSKLAVVLGNPFKTDLHEFVAAPDYAKNIAFIEEFHRDFDQTVNVLTADEEKIFIFIDDLDRADVPKAAELMQGLNMMISNSPRLIFVIGMDREKVAAGVAAKYRDLLPFLNPGGGALTTEAGLIQARNFGYAFLEKFIQLSFQIPKPSVSFTQEFINSLSGATTAKSTDDNIRYKPVLVVTDGEDTQQFREVTSLLAGFFDHNPRRLKQFVNAFRLKAHVAHSTGLFRDSESGGKKQPLTIPQLGKFIAALMLWPSLAEDLLLEPGLLRDISVKKTSDIVLQWRKNETLVALIGLKPADPKTANLYDLEPLAVWPLLETSPVFNHDGSVSGNDTKASIKTPASGPANVSQQRVSSKEVPSSVRARRTAKK